MKFFESYKLFKTLHQFKKKIDVFGLSQKHMKNLLKDLTHFRPYLNTITKGSTSFL